MADGAAESLLRVESGEGGVRTLVIDVADRPVNVLSPALRIELIAAVDEALADAQVRGLVITAERREFIAGADLSVLGTMRGRPAAEVRAFSTPFREMLRRMERGGKPVAAAINGTALGGGFELCLACHRRIAAEDAAGAVLGLPEATLGLLAGAGGTQRLGRLIGISRALPLLLEGRRLRPAEALEAGLVDELAPLSELRARAEAWVRAAPEPVQPWDRKGFVPPGGGPGEPANHRLFIQAGARAQAADPNDPAAEANLTCLFEGLRVDIDSGLEIEGRNFARLARGNVAQNRIRAFFSSNAARKAVARPADVPRFAPRRLGVLGAGMMGAGLAEVAARAGLDVVLIDRDRAAAEAGRDAARASMDKAVARGRLAEAEAGAALARIAPAGETGALAGVDAIIEAVYEDSAVKAEATRAALQAAGADTLFATNTSKIPIGRLAAASPAPDRFVGMHFFSPVPRMKLVEIIRGAETSDATLAAALDLARALGKTPVVVRDGPGFFTSRVFSTFVNEGMAMLTEGVAPALIENAARQAGYPVGPLEMADTLSQETMLRIRAQEREDLGEAWAPGPDHAVLERLVALGRRGRRHGAGFYDYGGGERRLWPGLAEEFPPAAAPPEPALLRERFLHVQAAEAARAWAEGVVDSPRMADVASLLGWSHPGWTGGVMSYIDQGGVGGFVARSGALAERFGPRFAAPERLRALAETGGTLYPEGGA